MLIEDIKDDELIAKYIGAKIVNAKDINALKYSIQDPLNVFHPLINGEFTFRPFKFRTDWNWLMVLAKYIIEDSKNPKLDWHRHNVGDKLLSYKCIDDVYYACLHFIIRKLE